MSTIGNRFQRVVVENEAPELFGEHAVEPVWCVSVQETRTYRAGPVWEVVAMLSLNCKTKKGAVQEAATLLREWAEALDAEAKGDTE
jgi:hypothetical protein